LRTRVAFETRADPVRMLRGLDAFPELDTGLWPVIPGACVASANLLFYRHLWHELTGLLLGKIRGIGV